MLTGKKTRLAPEEREIAIRKKQELRDKFELANLGNYNLIYPSSDAALTSMYDKLQRQAVENWEEFTTGRRRNPPTKFVVQIPK